MWSTFGYCHPSASSLGELRRPSLLISWLLLNPSLFGSTGFCGRARRWVSQLWPFSHMRIASLNTGKSQGTGKRRTPPPLDEWFDVAAGALILTPFRYKADQAFLVGTGKSPVGAYLDIPSIIQVCACHQKTHALGLGITQRSKLTGLSSPFFCVLGIMAGGQGERC